MILVLEKIPKNVAGFENWKQISFKRRWKSYLTVVEKNLI
jgi:hypothetical protein